MTVVSVVTVSFNSAATIRDTIESVLGQAYPHIEYIIVDGQSTDETLSIINEYRERVAKVISEPDNGIYDAMNKGIASATGDYVCFLNSDDIYNDTMALASLVETLERDDSDVAYANLVVVDAEDTRRVRRFYNSARFAPSRCRFGWMPAHPTMLVKRSVYEAVGPYKTDYEIAADYEMVVRLFVVHGVAYSYLPETVVRMRAGGVSTRGVRASWTPNKETVRACRTNGLRTNMFLVLSKIPLKILELVRRDPVS